MSRAPASVLAPVERWGLGVGLALVVVLMWPLRGYVTDDTFIHLQYARHLAEGQGPVFNPGERVYGSTSPLWVSSLAGAMALGFDGLRAARALGADATLASVALMFLLLRQTVRTPALRAAGRSNPNNVEEIAHLHQHASADVIALRAPRNDMVTYQSCFQPSKRSALLELKKLLCPLKSPRRGTFGKNCCLSSSEGTSAMVSGATI